MNLLYAFSPALQIKSSCIYKSESLWEIRCGGSCCHCAQHSQASHSSSTGKARQLHHANKTPVFFSNVISLILENLQRLQQQAQDQVCLDLLHIYYSSVFSGTPECVNEWVTDSCAFPWDFFFCLIQLWYDGFCFILGYLNLLCFVAVS